MKLKQNIPENFGARNLTAKCLDSCRRVARQIRRVRDSIFAETRNTLRARDQLIQLALNEAEALAWETHYPHLFFPALATEKVEQVVNWNQHQRSLDRLNIGARFVRSERN